MIYDRLAQITTPGSPASPAGSSMFGAPAAGVPVNDDSAMKFGAWWACIRVVSESLMILPWGVYEADGEDRNPQPDHPVQQLLRRRPNPEMPAYSFKCTILAHSLAQGNGYAEIERTRGGQPIALWLLDPNRVTPKRDSQNVFYYEVRQEGGKTVAIPADDMLHLRGPSKDGLVGMSTVAYARESISAGQAAERYGSTFFGNGGMPAGLVTHAHDAKLQRMEGDTLDNFYKSWDKRLKGPNKTNRIMYVDPGLSFTKIAIEPEDAQFIETRKLSVTDICRWFRVPPHKVADLDRATFSNIEQQSKEFVEDCILPWGTRVEGEINLKLLDGDDYAKVGISALLRADSEARSKIYTALLDRAVFNINDVLRLEDMNGIGPAGDVRMVPMNFVRLDQLGAAANAKSMGD